ncbi:MAG: hypothetical protein MI810_07365 [Flavobacteriales bacterium]|nr:hypothetical protein [Flavobacteriales bacterium]
MIQIDQNKALKSLEQALNPTTAVIDGRLDQDFLQFMADFSDVLNFYDQENKIYSSWQPLLLKDPIILLAYIAKSRYTVKRNLFLQIVSQSEDVNSGNISEEQLGKLVNQLFDLYTEIYLEIEQWTHYMKKHNHDYPLENYLFQEVKSKYAQLLTELLSLRTALNITGIIQGIKAVQLNLFEDFDPDLWKKGGTYVPELWGQNNDDVDEGSPWEIINLEYPLQDNSTLTIFSRLLSTGNDLFGFYKHNIDQATQEFENLKTEKNKFPDTILVRVFTRLLSLYTEAMNGLSKKHLNFYYRDILKQNQKNAQPDKVFVTAKLAPKTDFLVLAQGTEFKGGLNASKQPILFETLKETILSPAKIGTLSTLFQINSDSGLSELYLSEEITPNKLKKNEKGKLISWPGFGGDKTTAVRQDMAVAFASPMFFLQDGTRTLKLTFTFKEETDLVDLFNADYFLSTEKSWFDLKGKLTFPNVDVEKDQDKKVRQLLIEVSLDTGDPAIQAFKKNPDGYQASWPLFKIHFSQFKDLNNPPEIESLEVDVEVSGMKSMALENDNGKLSAKKPFELLGPTPAVNSSFFVGSSEIFSKPEGQICIELDWDGLPEDFKKYYEQYNKYLKHYDVLDSTGSKKPTWFKRTINWLLSNLLGWNIAAFQYSNKSFRVNFDYLQNGIWTDLEVDEVDQCTLSDKHARKKRKSEKKEWEKHKKGLYLFKESLLGALSPSTNFNCDEMPKGFEPLTGLQSKPLTFSDKTKDGFMKMTLVNPGFGFGLELYGKVVSYLALQNAKTLMRKLWCKKLKQSANVPYTPKVKKMNLSYSSSQLYTFEQARSTEDQYPLECFHYTPFSTYKSFDNSVDNSVFISNFALGAPLEEKKSTEEENTESSYLPLYVPFQQEGVQLINLQNLEGNSELNLFYELSRKIGIPNTKSPITYSALTDQGWQDCSLLNDGTQHFICSGILSLDIPLDPSSDTVFMPPKKYWLAIGVNEDLGAIPETVYLDSNGIELQRSSTAYLADTTAPKLAASKITSPAVPMPKIASLAQPFPSFGGKGAENETAMFKRVSNHLATKGRIGRSADYFRLIKENFPDVYYVKVIYDKSQGKTEVLLVKQVEDEASPSAFLPLVNECLELRVTDYLQSKVSPFTKLDIANFNPVYVTVKATIVVKKGFAIRGLEQELNQRLNTFLAPWIQDGQSHVQIDQGISESQLRPLIKSIEGVLEVQELSFITSDHILEADENPAAQQTPLIVPQQANQLFVPGIKHHFTFRAA